MMNSHILHILSNSLHLLFLFRKLGRRNLQVSKKKSSDCWSYARGRECLFLVFPQLFDHNRHKEYHLYRKHWNNEICVHANFRGRLRRLRFCLADQRLKLVINHQD